MRSLSRGSTITVFFWSLCDDTALRSSSSGRAPVPFVSGKKALRNAVSTRSSNRVRAAGAAYTLSSSCLSVDEESGRDAKYAPRGGPIWKKKVRLHRSFRYHGSNLTQKHIPKAIPTKDKALPRVAGVDTSDNIALCMITSEQMYTDMP